MSILAQTNKNQQSNSSITHLNENIFYLSSSKFNSYANLLENDNESNLNLDPVVVNDSDPDDTESNISLSFRQPSYISLSDDVITKGGDVIRDLSSILTISKENLINENEKDEPSNNYDFNNYNFNSELNPVIVFDSKKCLETSSETLSDSPIQLNVRQPSYLSLGPLDVIPKGSTSLSDYHPKIKEAIPNLDYLIDDEKSDNEIPVVRFIEVLNSKNRKKWKKIGFKPPENLIPLVRAASHHTFVISEQSSSKSFNLKDINTNYSHNNLLSNENDASNLSINKCGLKRSSSFGMDLGEAENKQIRMLNEIMGSSQKAGEDDFEENDYASDEFEINDLT